MLGDMLATVPGMPGASVRPVTPVTHVGTAAPLPGAVAALIGLAALVVMMIPFLLQFVEHWDSMAHEGAHAVVGSTLGFTVTGVTFQRNAFGGTSLLGPSKGPRWILTAFVGYLGPSAFGLWAAKLIETGHVITVLWLAIFALVLLLFLIRKSFGMVSVPVAIGLLVIVTRYAHTGLEVLTVYAMTWLLLLSGLRTAVVHGANAKDASELSAYTGIHRRIWALLWLAGAALALIIGAKWLVLRS